MTRRGILAVIGASILLALSTSSARASTDEERLAWFEPIARAAWPGNPCTGRENVHLHADAFMAEAGAQFGFQIIGYAMPSTCEVWMASNLDPELFCTVLVHEFGHLDGQTHNTIPGDIMNGNGDTFWLPCYNAVANAQYAGTYRWAHAHRHKRKGVRHGRRNSADRKHVGSSGSTQAGNSGAH